MQYKKILAIFAVFVIILSLFSIPVFAADEKEDIDRPGPRVRGNESYVATYGSWMYEPLYNLNDNFDYNGMKRNDTWNFFALIYITDFSGESGYMICYMSSSTNYAFSRGTIGSFNSSTGAIYLESGNNELYYAMLDGSPLLTAEEAYNWLFVSADGVSRSYYGHVQGWAPSESDGNKLIYACLPAQVTTSYTSLSDVASYLQNGGESPVPSESYSIQYYINGDLVNQLDDETSIPIFNPPGGLIPAGYGFAGWFYDVDFNDPALVGTPLTGDLVLYGKISKSAYQIIFNSNGGSAIADYYGDVLPSPLPVPTYSGYGFAGWYYDNGTFLNPASAAQKLILPAGTTSVTLNARWLSMAPGTAPDGSGISAYDYYINSNSADTAIRDGFAGLASLVMTGFLTFSSQIGFGGITLLSVLVTAAIIFVVLYVFKAIKGGS